MIKKQRSRLFGRQRVSRPSKEKLRIQNIVETLRPRLCECKVILQEIIWSLTPGRRCKRMTQALAERAVEVTSNVSYLLEGAEETPQLIDNIFQLEQTLRNISAFVQLETQWNLSLPILFAMKLRVRYFSLDRHLRGLLKPFEKNTVKKPLASVLCAGFLSTTIQEDHPCVDGALAEIVPPNNSSAIYASGSIFHNANNIAVHGGTFYAAHSLVVKQVQDYNRNSQGIVEGADVFTPGDVPPKKEIYKGRGYRVYSAHSTAKARAVTIKLYEGSCAKERCLAAARFSRKVMHPNVHHLIGVSPLNSELPFLVFDEGTEWAIEPIIASALSKDVFQSLFLGLQTVAGLSSGLDYLRNLLYPFASVGLDHFVVGSSPHGNILISFDPEVLPDETHEQDQCSGASDDGKELDIFHGLCQRIFDAACKVQYEFQKVQRSVIDELDADHDLDQFEEIGADAGTPLVDTKGPISDVLSSASSAPQLHALLSSQSSRRSLPKSSPSAHRRELVWKSQNNETVSLEEIARQFQSFLLTFSTESGFNRRRGRYTTKTAHRCPGYNRIEITLTPDIARSAIVSHLTPLPHEICPVCKEIVKDAEIFACICGRDDNESIPTIKCPTCSEWHHRPCISISENKDQSFVCQRCEDTRGSPSDCSSRASITPPPDDAPSPIATFIHVQIFLQKVLRPCPVPAVRLVKNDPSNPHIINLSPWPHVDPKIRASTSSNLCYLSGTVIFASPCSLALQSTFLVYFDDSNTPLHSEIAPLKCLSSPTKQSGGLYSSEIAPDFWDTLCSSPDLTRYTILQYLKSIHPVHFESNAVADSSRASPTVFIAYKFSYQEPGLQSNFNTVAPGPSVYPYPMSSSSHNQQVTMGTNHPQWRVPLEDADTKLNYSQMPAPSKMTSFYVPTPSDRSVQVAYHGQPAPVPMQRQDYAVVNSHPQLNYYPPNSTSSTGYERDSGHGQYWQHRH